MDNARTLELLRRHEGLRLRPYRDTTGHLTIGYGRNLDAKGISQAEAEFLLANDFEQAVRDARSLVDLDALDDVRAAVLVDMAFNLGRRRLSGFRRMLEALHQGDWPRAAYEMRDSLWAQQVKTRAFELSMMMESGQWPASR
ncbi:MAG: lysozyme [Anaerolineae bacterium]|nr:MAG: lysozyme [Anaerolineae bacterium]